MTKPPAKLKGRGNPQLTIRLEPPLIELADGLAEHSSRSRAAVLKIAAVYGITQFKKNDGLLDRAARVVRELVEKTKKKGGK